ncbi:MAG: ATP-binding protein [Polyangiales bacterium]
MAPARKSSDSAGEDQVEAPGAAEQAEARFRAMCECAPLGIFVSELGRGTVYVNPAMERILGWSAEELEGTRWQQAVHPEDRERLINERARASLAGLPYDATLRYLRKDGKLVWTNLHAAPMRQGDTVFGYVGTIEDVTENKRLQAQLAVSERLASLGTLAAGVGHEVNTPLAAALGNLEWLAARLENLIEQQSTAARAASSQEAGTVGERLRELQQPLRDARDAAERVRLIMQDLKLFSRSDEEARGAVDLVRVLDSATRLAWHELRHRARLVREDAGLPAVQGSEARLGQVFLNLLVNAAQAIPEGRVDENTVWLRTRTDREDEVIVEVTDTGSGIPPEVIDHIFDPFFTTKPRGVGTGLGLAICHRIVNGLGGHIEVESELGKGTTFRVVLRAASEPTAAVQSSRPAAPPARRGRVLVIDDDAAMTSVLALLVGEHHDVETASGGRAALERLRAGERYDAILCDLMMPDVSGMDFYAELEATVPDLVDRVIFLTGGAFTSRACDFLAAVPNERIDKPFAAKDLLALVNARVG